MCSNQLSSRLAARLGQLPHNVLADLAAQLCSDSPALQAAAEECMAAHNPLPHEMVERVLLSPDLVPHILGPLEAEDGAAAAVCSQWLVGWKATNEPRRRLKQVPLDIPEELVSFDLQMATTPDGRLVVSAGEKVHILDRSMRVLQTVPGKYGGPLAASDDSIFYGRQSHALAALRRSSHDGTVGAEYQLKGYGFFSPVLAPGGLLFCVSRVQYDDDQDEIIAFDAQTMQLRHRFGLGMLNDAQHLCVVADELYVCDTKNNRLQVFSLTGEHHRSIESEEWDWPHLLCFVKDRLYLVVEGTFTEHDDDIRLARHRIIVLSLQGDILQVVMHPTQPIKAMFQSICCFDHKLLVSYYYVEEKCPYEEKDGVLALQGL